MSIRNMRILFRYFWFQSWHTVVIQPKFGLGAIYYSNIIQCKHTALYIAFKYNFI